MKLDEIAPDRLMDMAYSRRRAEQIVSGLEVPINMHLLKLAAVPMPEQIPHWRQELTTWLTTIATIRVKPSTRPASAGFYFRILFDEPFGGNEVPALIARLQLLRQQYGQIRAALDEQALVDRLRAFHLRFAEGCAQGTMDLGEINALVDSF
ncbi:MAG TPA: hypothetical protein VE690_17330 [Rhodopila sp.]|nr:hypothetical protein [Rhodopila sp.]